MRNSAVDKSTPAPLVFVNAMLAATRDTIARPTSSVAINTSISEKPPFLMLDFQFAIYE
jgi:hypothetical protein